MQYIDSLGLSFKLGLTVSVILLAVTMPLALLFAFKIFPGKIIFESLFSLPTVLPPVVLGFFILQTISPNSFFGSLMEDTFGIKLAFSFTGIILAAALAGFPFMFSHLVTGLREMNPLLLETAWSLGKSPLAVLFKVIIPDQILRIISSVIICFAQVIGSFGIISMVGGNIRGQTNVVSIKLFELVEALEYKKAEELSLILVGVSFIIMIVLQIINHKKVNREKYARRGL